MDDVVKPTSAQKIWIDAKGRTVPEGLVEPQERIADETVRQIHEYANELMSQIARFRRHTYDDIGALVELLGEKYGMTPRGLKEGGRGNVTFKSYDGLMRVGISVQDYQEFGPELHIAKKLIDEFIHDVSEGVADEIKALLNHAFEVDKQGKIDRNMLYAVRRLNIQHPVFQRAVQAIKDSMRVASTREFITIEVRESAQDSFKALPINLANAYEVEDDAT